MRRTQPFPADRSGTAPGPSPLVRALTLAGALLVALAGGGVAMLALAGSAAASPVAGATTPTTARDSSVACPFTSLSPSRGFQATVFASGFPYDSSLQSTTGALDFPPCAGVDAPAFGPHGEVYVADFYSGDIYVLGQSGGKADQVQRLSGAHFGRDNLFALTFGRGGELYASLWGNQANALGPEIVEVDPSSGAEVRQVADLAEGLTYCPGRPAVSRLTGDLYVPGECDGETWETNAISLITNPASAHPVVSRFATLAGSPGGVAVAPNGSLYAEADWFASPEPVVEVAGPGGKLLASPVQVGSVPGGYSYGLAVSGRGKGGSAKSLEATDWQGNVYTLDLSHLPASVANDSTEKGAPTDAFYDGAGFGATRHGHCLYLTAGPALEKVCGGGGNLGAIASSLPTPAQAFSPFSNDVVNAGIAVAAAVFITFPADIFNNTFQENYADIIAWWSKRLDVFMPPQLRRNLKNCLTACGRWALAALHLSGRSPEKRSERQWASFALVVSVGAVFGALLDPGFAFNLVTLLTLIAIAASLVAGVALSGAVTHYYHRARRHGKISHKVEALPGGLLIALACVLISRGTSFQPGYLYGVIAGVTFGRKLDEREEGHVIALSCLIRLSVGVLAWLLWDALFHSAAGPGSFFGSVLADDFLAAFFVSALVGTVVSLFPLQFMPGSKLKSWHTGVWLTTFAVALFVLVEVLLRPRSGVGGAAHNSHVPLVTTLVLLVCFGVGSLAFKEHFARKKRRGHSESTDSDGTEEVPSQTALAGTALDD